MSEQNRAAVEKYAREIIALDPLFLDTETTGLKRTDEIIEISIIDRQARILFSSLVRPSGTIPPDAMAVHGISNDMVKVAQPWPLAWQKVRQILINRVICGYNIDFDIQMMQQSHNRYGLIWQEAIRKIDVLKLYSQYRGEWDPIHRSNRIYKLDEARVDLKIPIPNSHRSLDDAKLTRAVLFAMAGMPYENDL
jgi:DNA polymerase-3 subunit epsilon